MNIVFFDTETTGTEEADRICQIAWMQDGVLQSAYFKPPFPIPAEASAVHHISNKMVADKLGFQESAEFAALKALFEDEDTVAVAHNAKFDLGMLKKEGIIPKNHICTLRVARSLDTESALGKYNLQYLRYKLDLEVDEAAAAHSADGDVIVLEKLFERLYKKLCETKTPDEALKEMMNMSTMPSMIKSFNFGKHSGKTVAEVAKTDSGYLDWLLKSKLESSPDDEDWIYTLQHYLKK